VGQFWTERKLNVATRRAFEGAVTLPERVRALSLSNGAWSTTKVDGALSLSFWRTSDR